jgi:hypothetical protein
MFAVVYQTKHREDAERFEAAKADPSIDLWAAMNAVSRRLNRR